MIKFLTADDIFIGQWIDIGIVIVVAAQTEHRHADAFKPVEYLGIPFKAGRLCGELPIGKIAGHDNKIEINGFLQFLQGAELVCDRKINAIGIVVVKIRYDSKCETAISGGLLRAFANCLEFGVIIGGHFVDPLAFGD